MQTAQYIQPFDPNTLTPFCAVALDKAKALGVGYADIRIVRTRSQILHTREQVLKQINDDETVGFAIRVLVDGSWGFAASSDFSSSNLMRVIERATLIAKAYRALQSTVVTLAPTPATSGYWRTPMERDPFVVPIGEKIELQRRINEKAQKHGASFCDSIMHFVNERKIFASSDGAFIEQDLFRQYAVSNVTVVDKDRGVFETRRTLGAATGEGYEAIERYPFLEEIETAAEHAKMKLKTPSITPAKRDLIIHPTNLWLTIHESCAHPSELDRALGFEANFAGTSFLTPEKKGSLRYGSDKITMIADKTRSRGLSTSGFDDEGVPTCEFLIVDQGTFVNYQTTRELAPLIGDRASHATSYADNWFSVPLQRIPNISLKAGTEKLSLDDLIADTEDGLLVIGDDSWSIDMQRYNFQFSAQEFWEIKNGKRLGMVKDAAYQGRTTDFWNSCDAVCDESEYYLGGVYSCGKGQPCQAAPVSHGASPARFRQVNVLNTKSK